MDKRVMLKIKIKSLTEEAAIIRTEENRYPTGTADQRWIRNQLTEHRRGTVRIEQRHTLLAYGYIRGLAYSELERNPRSAPDWGKVMYMVRRYGPLVPEAQRVDEFKSWRRQERTT